MSQHPSTTLYTLYSSKLKNLRLSLSLSLLKSLSHLPSQSSTTQWVNIVFPERSTFLSRWLPSATYSKKSIVKSEKSTWIATKPRQNPTILLAWVKCSTSMRDFWRICSRDFQTSSTLRRYGASCKISTSNQSKLTLNSWILKTISLKYIKRKWLRMICSLWTASRWPTANKQSKTDQN